MKKKFIIASTLFVLSYTFGYAQEKDTLSNQLNEVVISDSKFAISKEKSGKIISKISAQDINNNIGQSVATLLNTVAGVEINGHQNGAGKNLGYYIRGGKGNQVLILIDGIPMVDASGIGFEYDLRFLPVEQVQSIEIMKGAASTLYGSGAATGVINIILKKNKSKKITANAFANLGTNQTANQNSNNNSDINSGFSLNGKLQKLNYIFGINNSELNGISQIANVTNSNNESDRFSRTNLLAKVGFEISKNTTLDFFGNYDKVYNDYDFGFDNTNTNDTPKNKSKLKQFRFGILPKIKYEKGELNLNASFNKTERNYSEFDTYGNAQNESNYYSRSINVDAFNKYNFSDKLFLVLGTQFQFHDMAAVSPFDVNEKKNTKFNTIDPYFTVVYNANCGLNLNLGSRLNVHSQYGNELVYNANPSFNFKNFPLKIVTSYSTAFITPSLYQLYSQYGNKDLTPEKSNTIEAGLETTLFDKKLQLNIVGFYREQNNFIGFYFNPITFDANYINIDGQNKAKGVETDFRFTVLNNLKLNANYTFTQVDQALDRLIPKHKINIAADYNLTKQLFLNANFQYVNQRNDLFFDGNTFGTNKIVLDAYKLVNATIRFDIYKNKFSVFGTLSNILNEDFVENVGYSSRGRNCRFGMNFNF